MRIILTAILFINFFNIFPAKLKFIRNTSRYPAIISLLNYKETENLEAPEKIYTCVYHIEPKESIRVNIEFNCPTYLHNGNPVWIDFRPRFCYRPQFEVIIFLPNNEKLVYQMRYFNLDILDINSKSLAIAPPIKYRMLERLGAYTNPEGEEIDDGISRNKRCPFEFEGSKSHIEKISMLIFEAPQDNYLPYVT